jgi:hypothetical protein
MDQMATYNLKRFARAEGLKAIERSRLLHFLNPFKSFFNERGLNFPAPSAFDDIDYDRLVGVLMNPDTDTPPALADALYFIHEMATPEGMDSLLDVAHDAGLSLDSASAQTPADIAVQIWLQDSDVLERKHAEQFLTSKRSFEYYQAEANPLPKFKKPNAATLKAMEKDLDDWFESNKRGLGARVFVFPKDDGVWFLVRHGNPFRREGAMDGTKSSSVLYRPEKYDVLAYDTKLGEIRMNAASKGEKDLYRKQFGKHLFGDEEFFPGQEKYTLEPLRTDGADSLECVDVDGIDWVRLKEIHYYWGGGHNEIEVRKADDIFAVMEDRGRAMPEKPKIIRASFQVKFTDSKTPRSITIKPPYAAQYTRDSDSAPIEDWLIKRGFVLNGHAK